MDKAPLMEFIRQMDHRHTVEMIEDMIVHLSDEQLNECVRRSFKRICDENSDVESHIQSVIENLLFDISSSYYDDEDEPSLEDMVPLIKDRFDFVRSMAEAGMDAEAEEFCRRIADGMERVSSDPRYNGVGEILLPQRDELLDLIEKGECGKWFFYRGLREGHKNP